MGKKKKQLNPVMHSFRRFAPYLLGVFLIVSIIWNIFSTIFGVPEKYFTFTYWQRFPSLKTIYLNSQYVNKNPKGWIPDEIVDSYAGGELIRGANPNLYIHDTPPLGKYLMGASALLFNNEHIITLICALLAMLLMYFIGKQIFGTTLLALGPPFLFSFEQIFKNQLIYSPLFDLIQLVFLLGVFYFFNIAIMTKKRAFLFFIIANTFLGFFISTKFFITGLPIIFAELFVVLLQKNRTKFIMTVLSLLSAPLVLLISYGRELAFNSSLRNFIGIQKWVFLYHKSQLILPFSIWPLILLNKWYVWFGASRVISDAQWRISWPIITILSLVTIGCYLFRKIERKKEIEILMAWVVFYFLFFSFGQIVSRYFVILIPVLYIVSFFGAVQCFKTFRKRTTALKKKALTMQKFIERHKRIVTWSFLFGSFLFIIAPLLHKGFFPTLDDVQVLRIDMMTRELRSGQFPVRYVNDLGNGGGYMLFNFYFPLAYYLGSLLHVAGIPLVKATKFMFMLAFLVGEIGMYVLLKKFVDRISAVIGAVLFLFSTYFLFDVYTRGDLAETLALALLPWTFFAFLSTKLRKSILWILLAGIFYGFLMTTHMMIAYAYTCILLLFFFIPPFSLQASRRMLYALVLGLGLSAFFWLPVALEHQFTSYSGSYFGAQSYKTNFLSFFDIVGLHLFAKDFKPPLLGLGLFGGVILSLTLVIWKKKASFFFLVSIIGFALSFILISPISRFLWTIIPFITLMQFPWRFLTIATVLAITSIGYGISLIKPVWIKILICVCVLLPAITLQHNYLNPTTYNFIATYYAEDICSTSTWDHEFLPKWAKTCLPKPPRHQNPNYPLIQLAQGKIAFNNIKVSHNGREISFNTTGDKGLLVIGRYYFPGWKATIDKKQIALRPYGKYGLLEMTMPAGSHTVTILLQSTATEAIGNTISIASILLVISVIIFTLKFKKRK